MKTSAITIGRVREEFLGDDEMPEVPSDLDAYIAVEVRLGRDTYQVGCAVGIQPSDQASARDSHTMIHYYGPRGPRAWWVDESDWSMLPDGSTEGVLEALNQAAGRLWREVEALREESQNRP